MDESLGGGPKGPPWPEQGYARPNAVQGIMVMKA